jgi:hypothetical protein
MIQQCENLFTLASYCNHIPILHEGRVGRELKRTMSSAAHPQTDGVTEQANRTISSMIRSYTFNRPTEWAASLPVLEIAYNDSVNGSTGYTPYFLCSGTNPILPLSLYSEPTFLAAKTAEKSVENYVAKIRKDIEAARAAMLKAQANQIKNANLSRRELTFEIGDQVLLSEGHFRDSTHWNLAQADGSTKKLNATNREHRSCPFWGGRETYARPFPRSHANELEES